MKHLLKVLLTKQFMWALILLALLYALMIGGFSLFQALISNKEIEHTMCIIYLSFIYWIIIRLAIKIGEKLK